MIARLRSRLSYANVASSLALFLALSTGTAYAANEWTGANIVDQSLTAPTSRSARSARAGSRTTPSWPSTSPRTP